MRLSVHHRIEHGLRHKIRMHYKKWMRLRIEHEQHLRQMLRLQLLEHQRIEHGQQTHQTNLSH
jgi:hypothetical protein